MTEQPGWQRWATRVARGVDRRVEEVRDRVLGPRLARQVLVYRGYGTDREIFIMGRVLANRVPPQVAAGDAWWRNLAVSLRHLESDEVPAARVRIDYAGTASHAVTDAEGYFQAWVPAADAHTAGLWRPCDVTVAEPVHPDAGTVHARGAVIVPPDHAAFGVISDIDDTVIRTEATRLLRMLRRTLLENARTRLLFAGVASFYAALHEGVPGRPANPIFYVSSSPWNLYPMLTEFLEHQDIPLGPLVLRDWGIGAAGGLPTQHGAHKLAAIRNILGTYPHLPFILIGDSGQEDPEIYRDIVHQYGRRILAVYIRDVSAHDVRRAVIGELSEEVRTAGSELLLSEDTLASAMHASARGWIRADAVHRVAEEVSSAASRPG